MGAGHSPELWEIYSFLIFQTFCTGIVEIPQNYEVIQNTFSLNKNLKINFRVRIGKRLISKVHCFTTSLLCWPWGHTLLNLILHTFIQGPRGQTWTCLQAGWHSEVHISGVRAGGGVQLLHRQPSSWTTYLLHSHDLLRNKCICLDLRNYSGI